MEPDNDRRHRPVYMIGVAADLAGVHPQTLRIYERKRLVQPQRTQGNTRLYSEADIERLRLIQELTQKEGINLAGVVRILHLEDERDSLMTELKFMREEMERFKVESNRQELVALRKETIVPLRDDATLRWHRK
ncbi:MAG: helix-turn-helix transcriptional regulator [Actinomycetia bacterium]|nr:helix-turn-helix transcriptional regulator [Actinomycetes bacterium]